MNERSLSVGQSKVKSNTVETAGDPAVQLYLGGVSMQAATRPGNPTGKGGGKRGKVVSWSQASRARMRKYLLTHRGKSGVAIGATLTIPGPPVYIEEAQRIWKAFKVRITRADVGAVWRIELQKRGQLHWHLLATGPDMKSTERVLRESWTAAYDTCGQVQVYWNQKHYGKFCLTHHEGKDYQPGRELRRPGELWPVQPTSGAAAPEPLRWTEDLFEWREQRYAVGEIETLFLPCRSMLAGAHRRGIQIETEKSGTDRKWLWYLQEHTTKRKQEQIPESIGRHWGVIRKDLFEQVMPEEVCRMTEREYARVLRWVQRKMTPTVKEPRCVFGRRLGYRMTRGRRGTTQWFCDPAMVRRMIEYACATDPASTTETR